MINGDKITRLVHHGYGGIAFAVVSVLLFLIRIPLPAF